MKKTYLAFACIFALVFTGCASKPEAADTLPPEMEEFLENTTTPETDAAETEESEQADAETGTEQIETPEAEPADEAVTEEISELEDIDEPVVITLEPAEIPEPAPEASEVPEVEPAAEPEPIEVETPPVIEDITVASSEETQNDNVDEVTDVSDSDDDVVLLVDDSAENSDTIDITNDSQEDSIDAEPVVEVEIGPSRKVTLKKQEYVDITYPGTGWVYMGLTDGSKDLTYFGRKLGTSDTKFTLQAKVAGTKILHFYKNDALTNTYIDDYIEVEVLAEKGSNKDHVTAPAYKQPVPAKAKALLKPKKADAETTTVKQPEAPAPVETPAPAPVEPPAPAPVKASEKKPSNAVQSYEQKAAPAEPQKPVTSSTSKKEETVPAVNETKTEPEKTIDTNVLLKEAEVLYNEKEYKLALEKLSLFFEHATTKRDKALYLKGQILEAKSPSQDIKGAMEAYNTLIKNYPASLLWDDANKRVIYLKRFYFGG